MARMTRKPKPRNFNPARGRFIQDKRILKGFTQEVMAAKLAIDQSTLSKWERGNLIPRYHWANLQRILGISDMDLARLESGSTLGPDRTGNATRSGQPRGK